MEHLTYSNIDISGLLSGIHSSKTGGLVMFSGQVRDHHKGKDVIEIFYEAYEAMADKMIVDILNDTIERFGLEYAQAVHRLGKVGISESAVVVITCHAHRANAYEANRYIIDKIKTEVPIWKREHYADGTYYWGQQ